MGLTAPRAIIEKIPGVNRLARAAYQQLSALLLKEHRANVERLTLETPAHKLNEKNLAGCRVLVDRKALLGVMPKAGIVAELGVDEGGFSAQILEMNAPSKLHLVDLWGSQRYNDDKAKAVAARFAARTESGQVEITRGSSVPAAARFDDGYFDWIYIDTDHGYRTTRDELLAWAPKVKTTGFIAGHDYTKGNIVQGVKYGVIEAVAEFCVERDWRLAYWTADSIEENSFAITRLTGA